MNSVAPAVLVALAGLTLAGCPKSAKLASGSDAGPSASARSSLSASASRPPRDPWRPSAEWTHAAGRDALELMRLADAEGTLGLLTGVEEGGDVREIALAALPLADDGEAALGRLGEIASEANPGEIQPILEAMVKILDRPLTQRERLDPDSMSSAARALVALSQRSDLTEAARATALSAARALAERRHDSAR